MISGLVGAARRKLPNIDWAEVVPRCGWELCARRTRWQALLRKSEGARFEDRWYCGPECLRSSLELRFETLLRDRQESEIRQHRTPLGLLLLSRGILDHSQLRAGLAKHRESGVRVGDCLRQLGAATEGEITAALAAQWGCPVYPAGAGTGCSGMVPRFLQERYRMLPMQWIASGRKLFVGFTQDVNYTLLFVIEQMLDCHAEPCIVEESELARRLVTRCREAEPFVSFATRLSAKEMARSVVSYAQQLGAEKVRLQKCLDHLWVRLERRAGEFDLFFRISK